MQTINVNNFKRTNVQLLHRVITKDDANVYCVMYCLSTNSLSARDLDVDEMLNAKQHFFHGSFTTECKGRSIAYINYYTYSELETREFYDDVIRKHIISCLY